MYSMYYNIIKKKRVNETLLELEREFETKNNKKYKVKAIINSMV